MGIPGLGTSFLTTPVSMPFPVTSAPKTASSGGASFLTGGAGDSFSPSTALDFSSPSTQSTSFSNPFTKTSLSSSKGFDETETAKADESAKTDSADSSEKSEESGDGEKKPKMTMGEFLNLTLYARRPDGTIDWGSFAAKYQTDEKPVKVHQAEGYTMGSNDGGE